MKSWFADVWKWRISYLFIAPFLIAFIVFTIIPVAMAVGLSFTYFNAIEFPTFAGWMNYQSLFSQDLVFLRDVLPNTFKFALFVGPVSYMLAFLLAWLISQLPRTIRTVYALAIYTPSLTMGAAMVIIWQVMFTGDRTGYINAMLLRWNIVDSPILFVTDKDYLLNVMITVSIWSGMGVGFLALLAGILNIDRTLYEAARIDGMKSRLQEIMYITIPMMKPQMLFAAVMSLSQTLKAGDIGVQLSGQNPTPGYAGQLILNHVQDYGFIRYELGYASAVSVIMLLMMLLITKLCWSLLGTKEDGRDTDRE
ncbi:carbohydrate ABC transporter permease [Cohnella yongneupensis]|uniref:Carbohydrate ABC transporter permease n=1 Tax=Cohnella yongneupensis TaxID=425006 RepID=A0ABW0R3Z9_9BACL